MRPRFSCLCVIVACAVFTVVVPLHATDAKDEQDDVRLLRRYLTPDGALPTDERDVKALLSRVQFFRLHFKRDVPLANDADRDHRKQIKRDLEKLGLIVMGIDRHKDDQIYPEVEIWFSQFYDGFDPDLSPQVWLDAMHRPIAQGYTIELMEIVYRPTAAIKQETLTRWTRCVEAIASDVRSLKKQFPQLDAFGNDNISNPQQNEGDWPDYPKIRYRFGFGGKNPRSKGGYYKTTKNWSKVWLGIVPVKGRPRAMVTYKVTFERQGIDVLWSVGSNDAKFNKMVTKIIRTRIKVLEDYEHELNGGASRPKRHNQGLHPSR